MRRLPLGPNEHERALDHLRQLASNSMKAGKQARLSGQAGGWLALLVDNYREATALDGETDPDGLNFAQAITQALREATAAAKACGAGRLRKALGDLRQALDDAAEDDSDWPQHRGVRLAHKSAAELLDAQPFAGPWALRFDEEGDRYWWRGTSFGGHFDPRKAGRTIFATRAEADQMRHDHGGKLVRVKG